MYFVSMPVSKGAGILTEYGAGRKAGCKSTAFLPDELHYFDYMTRCLYINVYKSLEATGQECVDAFVFASGRFPM